jgi:subtilisin family serine protease
MSVRTLVTLAAAAAVLGIAALPASGAPAQDRQAFIVVLNDSVSNASPVALEHSRRFGADVSYVYNSALKGYAATIAPNQLGALQADGRVAAVELDGEVAASTTQNGATWGLDRIDQHSLPLSGTFTYASTGAGVKAYVIDTGIRTSHNEFGGRAFDGTDAVDGSLPAADCNGHGTHVAGTIGGSTYGVAKGVTLVAVRVLNCNGSGTTSGVIAGIDWVTADHQAGQPAVANMSLGGGASSALDTAVRNSIADGVSYAIAAGNGNIVGKAQDACKSSPARVTEAMTIGATSSNDQKASWSNYGNCVDWFAPGVSVTSSWSTSNTATNTISGTSMATPHTTGVAALYLQGNPTASPAAVRDALYAKTTKGIVTSSKTANNHLLFTDF